MAHIHRESVDSSCVASLGYSADQQVLDVEFHSGAVYRYFAVPQAAWQRLMSAESTGRHFQRFIRNCYRFVRLSG